MVSHQSDFQNGSCRERTNSLVNRRTFLKAHHESGFLLVLCATVDEVRKVTPTDEIQVDQNSQKVDVHKLQRSCVNRKIHDQITQDASAIVTTNQKRNDKLESNRNGKLMTREKRTAANAKRMSHQPGSSFESRCSAFDIGLFRSSGSRQQFEWLGMATRIRVTPYEDERRS